MLRVAIADTLVILFAGIRPKDLISGRRQRSLGKAFAHLIFTKKRIANPGKKHHGHEERDRGLRSHGEMRSTRARIMGCSILSTAGVFGMIIGSRCNEAGVEGSPHASRLDSDGENRGAFGRS